MAIAFWMDMGMTLGATAAPDNKAAFFKNDLLESMFGGVNKLSDKFRSSIINKL
ncbi:hypothetical protein PBAL39_09261 [Pedobacter sp. BAL39]|nr:hypothetical protein PBAL39_09261 [Pedobacter sp. BAL39]